MPILYSAGAGKNPEMQWCLQWLPARGISLGAAPSCYSLDLARFGIF